MSFILTPVLTTPLLKIPLLMSGSICAYLALTNPNPRPRSEEISKFGRQLTNLRETLAFILQNVAKPLVVAKAFVESAIILARQYPSSPVSERVLEVLLPNPASTYGAEMSRTFIAGWALMFAGSLLRLWCHRTLGRFFTWELAVKDDHKLITEGPYAYVRHPSYTSMFMIVSGILLCSFAGGSWWVERGLFDFASGKVFAAMWFVFWTSIPVGASVRLNEEDDVLKKEFGAEWDAWVKKTPYKMIPFVF